MPQKTNKNEFTGLWIPKEIWQMNDLNLTEKCFLAVIVSFSTNGNECSASNSYFANLFGITKNRASIILSTLYAKKHIGISIFRDTLTSQIVRRVCVPTNKGISENSEVIIKSIIKKDNKESIEKIQSEFLTSLNPFISDFGQKTVNDFFKYWSEPNKSKTKIRYQLEKTWDSKRRLEKWKENEKKFTGNGAKVLSGNESMESSYEIFGVKK